MRTPWIKLYVGDFIADTHQLTTLQFGAYVRLVHNYYQHGGLPEDDAQLARIAGLSAAEWRRESKVLRRFFKDGWRHARCEREMLGAQEAHQRRSRAGQAANEARWRSSHSNPNRIHTGSELEPEPEPEPEPESEKRPSQREESLEGKGTSLSRQSNEAKGRRLRLAVVNASGEGH